MDGLITGENDERVGLSVIDNNDTESVIEMEFGGEIKYHEWDGYADKPSGRTRAETERLHQARRFAKWHVYRERGYDTLTPYDNPDRITAAVMAIRDLTEVEIHHHFGDLRKRLDRHHRLGEMDIPFEDADPDDMIVYRQDVWLEPDPTGFEPPVLDRFCEYTSDPMETLEGILDTGPDPRESLPTFEIEATSDIHYLYSDGFSKNEHWTDQPLDREPDARIELMPLDIDAFDSFGELLASHLVNQVRDCFLEMGSDPPEPFQTPGLGKHDAMVKQQLMDIYDRRFLSDQDSWGQELGKP